MIARFFAPPHVAVHSGRDETLRLPRRSASLWYEGECLRGLGLRTQLNLYRLLDRWYWLAGEPISNWPATAGKTGRRIQLCIFAARPVERRDPIRRPGGTDARKASSLPCGHSAIGAETKGLFSAELSNMSNARELSHM